MVSCGYTIRDVVLQLCFKGRVGFAYNAIATATVELSPFELDFLNILMA